MSALVWKTYLDGAVRTARDYAELPEVNPSGTLIALLPRRHAEVPVEERECLRVEHLRDGSPKLDLVGTTNLRSYAWLDDATLVSVRDARGGMHFTNTRVEDASTEAELLLPGPREARFLFRTTPDRRTLLAWTTGYPGDAMAYRLNGITLEEEASAKIPFERWELHPDGALMAGGADGGRAYNGDRYPPKLAVRSALLEPDDAGWTWEGELTESLVDWKWRGRSEVTLLLTKPGPFNAGNEMRATFVRCVVLDLHTRAATSELFEVDRLMKLGLSPHGDRIVMVERASVRLTKGCELKLSTRDVTGGKKRGSFRVQLDKLHWYAGTGNIALAWARDGKRFVINLPDVEWTLVDVDLNLGRAHHVETPNVPCHSGAELRVHGTWCVERDRGMREIQCTDLAALK